MAINFEVISLRDGKPSGNRAITRTTRAKGLHGSFNLHVCIQRFQAFPLFADSKFQFAAPFQFTQRGNCYAYAIYDKPLLDKYRINVQYSLLFYYWFSLFFSLFESTLELPSRNNIIETILIASFTSFQYNNIRFI